jgi:alpha-tubulin suppressor-like RCC1 family protein
VVKCWGSDEYGKLGRGGPGLDAADPRQVEPLDFGTERRVVRLTAGWHHACVLFEDRRARCWGRDDRGQLGRGPAGEPGGEPAGLPRDLGDIALQNIIEISAGVSNTCAIVAPDGADEGTVHCWGSDLNGGIGDLGSGDFGDDEPLSVLRPVELGGNLARSVAAGDSLGCALLAAENEDDKVRCWGNNASGTLGIGSRCNIGDERPCDGSPEPRPVVAVRGLGTALITRVHVNQAHACALDNTGALRCWGRNDQSRAGYPEVRHGAVLVQPPGPVNLGPGVQVVSVGLGVRHGCALDGSGDVRCWGEAGPQLGYAQRQMDGVAGVGGTLEPGEQYAARRDNGVVQILSASEREGGLRVDQLFVGGFHNCVVLARGEAFAGIRCWGHNQSGELGYGAYEQIGSIGELGSPSEDYERLELGGVCLEEPCAGE